MVEVVAHDGSGLVEQRGDFSVGLALEALGQEISVVPAASLDELLLDRGALFMETVSRLTAENAARVAAMRGGRTHIVLFLGHLEQMAGCCRKLAG